MIPIQKPQQGQSTPVPPLSQAAEEFIKNLAGSLEIPDSRYEEAEKRYKSVGNWLKRPGSVFEHASPDVHTQGSFALGTVIKPVSEDEEYDIDMICSFEIDSAKCSQEKLKNLLKYELAEYAKKYSMQEPESHRRCVRVRYADSAQFHLDATPARPDRNRQRVLLEQHKINNEWAALAISITDEKHPAYKITSTEWPRSNPRGYLKWFRSRMQVAFDRRRQEIKLAEKRANVEEIPEYRVKTPLQSAIQILKRHRDMTYDGEPDNKPISIIITTLAALAYNQEGSIHQALFQILFTMDKHIQRDTHGRAVILNPTDPLENFADKWREFPEREEAFYEWLQKARTDLVSIAGLNDLKDIAESLSPVLGPKLVENALGRHKPAQGKNSLSSLLPKWSVFNQPHKQQAPWPVAEQGYVKIKSAEYKRQARGSMWRKFDSNGTSLPKNCDLVFEAVTNIPEPYDVYWQVVNTGHEAGKVSGLRGGFDKGDYELGRLKKKESTSYRGSHTIECFIVKNSRMLARSGPFIVNIQ